jgi:hypothetical protein
MANCLLRIGCLLAKDDLMPIKKDVMIEFSAGSDKDAADKALVFWRDEIDRLKKEGRIIKKVSTLYREIPFP